MTMKRRRPESPESARKRDASTRSASWNSCVELDRSGSLEPNTIVASRASTLTPSSFGASTSSSEVSSSIDRSIATHTNSHTLSPTVGFPDLNTSFMRHTKRPAVITDTNGKETGLTTPLTNGEQTHEGTIVSPYVANDFRYPPSASLTVYAPTESFPMFHSGDVLIKTALQPARQWQLHSHILMRHSPWFARAVQDTIQNGLERPTWFLFMIEDINGNISLVRHDARGNVPAIEDTHGDMLSRITIKREDAEDATISTKESSTSSEDGAVAPTSREDYTATIDIFNEIFGAFYNVPALAPSVNISAALTHAEKVVQFADSLGCLHLLTAHIGNTLLQYRQSLFTAIKDDPARWLRLSIAIRNDNMYTEALIHLVGAHPCWPWPTKRQSLPEEIRRLIAHKSSLLDAMCLETERDLLTLTIDVRNRPVVPEIKSQFDTWFVVSVFRHVFATEITNLENDKKASLKRGSMFRKIAKGGCEYMDTEDMRRYMAEIMPSALDNASEDLALLKRFAKRYVEELARNELMMDVEANPVGYLTCAKVGSEDIPWRAAGLSGV